MLDVLITLLIPPVCGVLAFVTFWPLAAAFYLLKRLVDGRSSGPSRAAAELHLIAMIVFPPFVLVVLSLREIAIVLGGVPWEPWGIAGIIVAGLSVFTICLGWYFAMRLCRYMFTPRDAEE